MKFSEIPYSRIDKDELLLAIDGFINSMKEAKSADEQAAIFKDYETELGHFATSATIAHVRNTIDTRDKFYEEEREYNDNISPIVEEKSQEFDKVLLNSKFRTELEKRFGSLLFKNIELSLKGFSPEIIPLLQEESKLAAAYQKLYASAQIEFEGKTYTLAQLTALTESTDREVRKTVFQKFGEFFDENQAEFDDLFDKLVKNRDAQAKKLGFENFIPLGYIRQRRNCYASSDVATFREEVVKDIVPVVNKIKENQSKRIGVPDMRYYDQTLSFKDGNPNPIGTPEEILAAGKKMYTEMSKETASFIDKMFEMNLFDVMATEGKAPGGYCTDIADYKVPFIFSNFNGTAGDVDVLTHEAGHAFAAITAMNMGLPMNLLSPSLEGCETHSMAMEFLTTPWHHLFFGENTKKYQLSHAEDSLVFIPYGCQVDHFQEICYSNPNLTPAQRNEEWAKLEKLYRPYMNSEGMAFFGRGAGWQRQLHIYLYPFYYIEYCMAQTMALQFFAEHLKNKDSAFKKYLDFVNLAGTKTFVDLVEASNLLSPLKEGNLKTISSTLSKWLSENQV